MQEITRAAVRERLPARRADSNKGSYGSVLTVAGSMAYRGAAALCVEGALRGGAGLVYLASVEPVIQLVLARTPECCACGCRTDADGGIHPQDTAALRAWFAGKNTILLAGPGLGESAGDVCNVLLGKRRPWAAAVLDADALNALAAGKLRASSLIAPRRGRPPAAHHGRGGPGRPGSRRPASGGGIPVRGGAQRARNAGGRPGRHGVAQYHRQRRTGPRRQRRHPGRAAGGPAGRRLAAGAHRTGRGPDGGMAARSGGRPLRAAPQQDGHAPAGYF